MNELINLHSHSIKFKINCVKQKLLIKDQETWTAKLFNDWGQENGNKLWTYRIYKASLMPETFVKQNINRSHCRILAKFRSESLPLHIETDRYSKPKVPLNNGTCKFCSLNQVEEEIQFLKTCDVYSDLRRALMLKAQSCNTDLNNTSLEDKFIFMMNYVNLQYTLSATLVQMYNRRKRLI